MDPRQTLSTCPGLFPAGNPRKPRRRQATGRVALLVLVLIFSVQGVDAQTSGGGSQGISGAGSNTRALKLLAGAEQLYRQGKVEEALDAVRQARRNDPYLTTTYQMEAQILFDLGDTAGFRSMLKQILTANPQSASLHNAVGKLLLQSGQTGDGLEALQRAVSLDPHKPQIARDLAAGLVAAEQPEEAARILVESIRNNPQDESLPVALGRVYESTGDWKQAAGAYARGIRKDEDDQFCSRQLARCLYLAGEYKEAVDAYARCAKQKNRLVTVSDSIQQGDACMRIGRYQSAQKIFDRVAAHTKQPNRNVEKLRAICALRRKDKTDAKKITLTALKTWPDDPELKQLLALTEEKTGQPGVATVAESGSPKKLAVEESAQKLEGEKLTKAAANADLKPAGGGAGKAPAASKRVAAKVVEKEAVAAEKPEATKTAAKPEATETE